jgi:hypothetical protein
MTGRSFGASHLHKAGLPFCCSAPLIGDDLYMSADAR